MLHSRRHAQRVEASMDDTMRPGFAAIRSSLVSEGMEEWDAVVRAFVTVTGRDMEDPVHAAFEA